MYSVGFLGAGAWLLLSSGSARFKFDQRKERIIGLVSVATGIGMGISMVPTLIARYEELKIEEEQEAIKRKQYIQDRRRQEERGRMRHDPSQEIRSIHKRDDY